jgi:hypothetical protein
MGRRVALARTDVSEKRSTTIIRVTRIGVRSVRRLLLTANAVLMMEEILSSEMEWNETRDLWICSQEL